MDSTWNAFKTPQLRRLGVAVAITGAAAAVAAGVVLGERRHDDRLLPSSAGTELRWPGAATPAGGAAAAVALPIDVSLPDAAEALKGVATRTTEMPATF